AAGVWTYTLNNSNSTVQALNVGGTLTDTFTVNTVDGTAQVVTVTIQGSNDAPIITSSAEIAGLTELANAHGSTTLDTTSNTLNYSDVDISDTHTATVTGVVASGTTAGLPVNATLLTFLSTGTLTEANGATGTIPWNFSAQDQTFDYLTSGQTVTLTYTVRVTDAQGLSSSQTVAVTVTGT